LDSLVQKYVVGENQQCNYIFLVDTDAQAKSLHLCFSVQRNAQLTVELIIARADAQITIDCILQEEGAQARITGAYVGDESHSIKITTLQHHQAPNTSSTLVMKGALHSSAQAKYVGTIRIDQKAKGSHASQENKNMLFSPYARAISVPNLEVLNHEVTCFHGSAVGRCDDAQLFYAATRGIDEMTAQRLLLRGFFGGLFVSDELNKRLAHECI
jgi:Fe-S cluster assembly protein SufD